MGKIKLATPINRGDFTIVSMRDRIQGLIDERKLSPKRVSLDAGLHETFVRDILVGRVRAPRVDHIRKLAAGLNVTVEYLIEGREGSGETAEIINLWSRISESDQALVVELLTRLSKGEEGDAS